MIKIELASYPKSGNTWFRHIARDYFAKLSGDEEFPLPLDIHMSSKPEEMRPRYVKPIEEEVLIYKSHIFNNSRMKPDRIIHIYRHPLDVFLSAINFFYHQAGRFDKDRLESLFKEGKPKSVEEIAADKEMGLYFDQFLSLAGSNYWPEMLGVNSNYFNYIRNARSLSKTTSIRYEDMLLDTTKSANVAFKSVFGKVPDIAIDTESIDNQTKHSKNKQFFWKSKYKNYEKYLTANQIGAFEERYSKELAALGYL